MGDRVVAAHSGAAVLALVWVSFAGCQETATASRDVPVELARRAQGTTRTPSDGGSQGASATSLPGYPVDGSPPKDFFSDRLLRTLAREASATVACRLVGLQDVFRDRREPDVFYDASCQVLEVLRGPVNRETLHFIWQVERGNRMPPPGSELLVFLKARKEPLDSPPPLKWVALDTGVLRYTPALKDRIRLNKKSKKK